MIGGITSTASRGCNRHFAIAELAEIAQNPKLSARRKAIFSDIRNSSPSNGKNAWNVIFRETLLILGRDYRTLLAPGKSQICRLTPSTTDTGPLQTNFRYHLATSITPTSAATQQAVAKTTSAMKQAQYAIPHRSTQDQILDLAASSLQSAEHVVINRVPRIYNEGSASLSTLSSAHPTSTGGVLEVVASLADKVQRPSTLMPSWAAMQAQMPSFVRNILSIMRSRGQSIYLGFVVETTARKLSVALPNVTLDALAIQGM